MRKGWLRSFKCSDSINQIIRISETELKKVQSYRLLTLDVKSLRTLWYWYYSLCWNENVNSIAVFKGAGYWNIWNYWCLIACTTPRTFTRCKYNINIYLFVEIIRILTQTIIFRPDLKIYMAPENIETFIVLSVPFQAFIQPLWRHCNATNWWDSRSFHKSECLDIGNWGLTRNDGNPHRLSFW